MDKTDFEPFSNEEDCVQIGELTIENRTDRVSIFGSIDLTLDKDGMKKALNLKNILELIIAIMEKSTLPEQIAIEEAETVKNPFA